MDKNVQEALCRAVENHTHRDREFELAFGNWERPEFAPRYDLEKMKHLIRWTPGVDGMLDVSSFVRMLRDETDKILAAEVAKFTAEEFDGEPATDKTLGLFRLHFLRRLDACGF